MTLSLRLRGPAGEPVDLARTLLSHGLASLPPMSVADDGSWCEATFDVGRSVHTVRVEAAGAAAANVSILGRAVSASTEALLLERVRRMLNLDQDLSRFYALVREDPDLAWAARGAGRMVRSQSVFEEVIKTVCTTNCAWSATVRMVRSLVQHLGRARAGAPAESWEGRAFPSPAAIAGAGEDFYKEVVRAGYRGPYLRRLGEMVAANEVDLESWATASADELPDEELAKRLQSLPGVGPYAAAHIMMMLGRHSLLVLDSWTRPTYARLVGRRSVPDKSIVRRFARYRGYAGLAFWLFLTEEWVSS